MWSPIFVELSLGAHPLTHLLPAQAFDPSELSWRLLSDSLDPAVDPSAC